MADGYSWILRVNGERLASGTASDEGTNATEGFRYMMQYASEGTCVVVFRHGRKKIGEASVESMTSGRRAHG